MKRQRTPQQEERPRGVRAAGGRKERMAVAHDSSQDDLEGQLGPDELPDPAEVVMRRQANRQRG